MWVFKWNYYEEKGVPILSTTETSQSGIKDEVDMKRNVSTLEEELRDNKKKVKKGKEKYEKIFKFMILKLLYSQNLLCPPDKDGVLAHDDMTDILDQ